MDVDTIVYTIFMLTDVFVGAKQSWRNKGARAKGRAIKGIRRC